MMRIQKIIWSPGVDDIISQLCGWCWHLLSGEQHCAWVPLCKKVIITILIRMIFISMTWPYNQWFASRVAVDDEHPEESSGIMKQIAFLEVPLLLFIEHIRPLFLVQTAKELPKNSKLVDWWISWPSDKFPPQIMKRSSSRRSGTSTNWSVVKKLSTSAVLTLPNLTSVKALTKRTVMRWCSLLNV